MASYVVKRHRLSIEAENCQMEAEVVHSAAAQSCSASAWLSLFSLSFSSLSLLSPLFSSPQSAGYANIQAATLVIRTIVPQWWKQDFNSDSTDLT